MTKNAYLHSDFRFRCKFGLGQYERVLEESDCSCKLRQPPGQSFNFCVGYSIHLKHLLSNAFLPVFEAGIDGATAPSSCFDNRETVYAPSCD